MKKRILLLLTLCTVVACNTDEKAIETVMEELEYGAVIRTIEFNNSEFVVDDLSSVFSVVIEEQDEEDGALLETVEIYVRFQDNTPGGDNFSTQETRLGSLIPEDFTLGPNGFPRMTLELGYQELLTTTGVAHSVVECKDQFLVRLEVRLTNGLVLTVGNASSIILAFDTFFSSPYCYTINVVEPIDPDSFTGTYFYSSVEDGPLGPTFGPPQVVQISRGHSNTVRTIPMKHILSHPSNELPRDYEFSIVCDEAVFQKNQLSSVIGECGFSGGPILLGPGPENAPINPDDDSGFELWFVEGYLGFDGGCGFGTAPSRIRFTKQ